MPTFQFGADHETLGAARGMLVVLGALLVGVAAAQEHSCAVIGCGGNDGTCWCEETCKTYGDCCDDYDAICGGARPAPPLVMQDVNIFVTTDTHAWLAGRDPHEPRYNATAADVVDVVEAARAAAAERGQDVFFFDNGDVIDGTGLSATAADHADYVAPLLAT